MLAPKGRSGARGLALLALSLGLCLSLVTANPTGIVRRNNDASAATSLKMTPIAGSTASSAVLAAVTSTGAVQSSSSSAVLSSTVSTAPSSSATLVLGNGTALFNSTIPAGQLPLQPRVTPGWAVAGVVLLLTGVAYGGIGIRSRPLHAFFSMAFLAGLGTTVLIVYLMSLPVSDAVQGAYVVAAVGAGAVLGGAALVFPALAESLGCLLGGFCLSMWLLMLQPGGLLPQSGGTVGLISAFSVAFIAAYFVPRTRVWLLMGCIAFSGATAAVLGIDCLSRAGLKEFWAYVWALDNTALFPLGTTTYPLTRGIQAELAAIVLLAVAGVVSQLRLWETVRKRQRLRDAEREAGERRFEEEEETVGRRIEAAAERERVEWERVNGGMRYCGKEIDGFATARPLNPTPMRASADSGIGNMDENKRPQPGNLALTLPVPQPLIEMTEVTVQSISEPLPFPLKKTNAAERLMSQNAKNGVTIWVAADADDEDDGREAQHVVRRQDAIASSSTSLLGSVTEADLQLRGGAPDSPDIPDIVPLPLVIPIDARPEYCSSIEKAVSEEDTPSSDKKASLIERQAQDFNGDDTVMEAAADEQDDGDCDDGDPVKGTQVRDESDSIVATLDELSSIGDLGSERDDGDDDAAVLGDEKGMNDESGRDGKELASIMTKPAPLVETASTDVHSTSEAKDGKASYSASTRDESGSMPRASMDSTSSRASLSRENLPRSLSKVALTYRTNEWAKHLSAAETPRPDSLRLDNDAAEAVLCRGAETPAPLNPAELQQTAENAALPPARPRAASAMSSYSQLQQQQVTEMQMQGRSVSAGPPLTHQNKMGLTRHRANIRRASAQKLIPQPIAEEGDDGGRSSMSSEPSPSPSPQTLIGVREKYLREKSYSSMPNLAGGGVSAVLEQVKFKLWQQQQQQQQQQQVGLPTIPASDTGSGYNGAVAYGATPRTSVEMDDDLPLSQRRELLRGNSLSSSLGASASPASATAGHGSNMNKSYVSPTYAANDAARQAQLAGFRSIIGADLRGEGAAALPPMGVVPGGSVVRSPYQYYGGSTANIDSSYTHQGLVAGAGSSADLRRSIDAHRGLMLEQRDAAAHIRRLAARERERGERAAEIRMRSGEMLAAHRDALRRLQGEVRD